MAIHIVATRAGGASVNELHLGGAPALSPSRRSSGSIKGGATTVEDERGPGLDIILCFIVFVWPADVREGLPALLSFCLFILY